MKKSIYLLLISILSIAGIYAQGKGKGKQASKAASSEISYTIDAEKSIVAWEGKKVGGKHNGKIKIANGTITTLGNNIQKGSITIDMNSMTCDDIADAEYNGKLIGHLKNEDFFNTAAHPTSSLEINSVKSLGAKKTRITGNLTIKGTSLPVTFDANITSINASSMMAKAKIVFDRTKYDVKYGSTLFGAAADKAIDDKVSLDIHLVASK